MSCKPNGLSGMAEDYLITHELELSNQGRPFTTEQFRALVEDLTLELEGAIVDRWLEWRDKQNERLP